MATPKRLRPVRWAYDLLRDKFKPRQKPLTPPGVGVFDSPSACVKVNLQWSSHVIGALEVLNQADSWAGTDLQQFNARQEIEKLLNALAVESICESDMPTLLRQNPENPCQLEYSTDGATWALAFDYSLCLPGVIGDEVERVIKETPSNGDIINFIEKGSSYFLLLKKEYNTTYTQNITNMYPTLVVQSGEQPPAYNEDALCYLCNLFVDSVCDAFIEAINAKNNQAGINQQTALALVIGIGLVVLTAMATGGIGLIWGATVAGVSGASATAVFAAFWAAVSQTVTFLVYNNTSFEDPTPFYNQESRRRVACCMFNNMQGLPSEATWRASASSCDFSNSNEPDDETIRSAIDAFLNEAEFEAYLGFIDMYGGIAQGIADENITNYECLCDEWWYMFDFTETDGAPFVAPWDFGVPAAVHTALGWSHVDVQETSRSTRTVGINVVFDKTAYIIDMSYQTTYQKGTTGTTDFGLREQLDGLDENDQLVVHFTSNEAISSMNVFNGTQIRTITLDKFMNTAVRGRIQYFTNWDLFAPYTWTGTARIEWMLWHGRGRCPFGAPNYFPPEEP